MRREILVVEDEEQVRAILSAALGAAGYTVTTVPDRAAMNARLAAHLAPENVIVLMDIALDGDNGVDAARDAAAKFGPLKFIFMSGFADDVVMMGESHAADGAAFLRKPFEHAELLAAVATMSA